MSWDEIYRENILDHYRNPRNRGTLEHPDITYEDANPLCGDHIRMDLNVRDGRVDQVRFSGHDQSDLCPMLWYGGSIDENSASAAPRASLTSLDMLYEHRAP